MRRLRAFVLAVGTVVILGGGMPGVRAVEPSDLDLGYQSDRIGMPLRGSPMPGPARIHWRIVEPRLLTDGRLALTVEVDAPWPELPLDTGPAVLLGSVTLNGGAGGDVGLEWSDEQVVHALAEPCADGPVCTYRARIILPTDRAIAVARRPVSGSWYGVSVALTLVRTFDQGRWLSPVLLDGYASPMRAGRLTAPAPFEGTARDWGMYTASQARVWARADDRGRRDPWAARALARVKRVLRAANDPSERTPTTAVTLDVDTTDCRGGLSLATSHGDTVFDTSDAGPVRTTVAVPSGTTWWLTAPRLDAIEIPAEDAQHLFGPFEVGSEPVTLTGAWSCTGDRSGDIVSSAGPATTRPAVPPPPFAGRWPGFGERPPDPPVGRAWQRIDLPGPDGERALDVVPWRDGFVALGRREPWSSDDRVRPQVPVTWVTENASQAADAPGVDASGDPSVANAWRRVSRPFPGVRSPAADVQRLAVVGDRLLAFGHDGRRLMVWRSTDGVTWERVADARSLRFDASDRVASTPLRIDAVAVSGARAIVIGTSPTGTFGSAQWAWWSDDGTTWHRVTPALPDGGRVRDLVGTQDGFVALTCCADGDRSATLSRSSDGVTWDRIGAVPGDATTVGVTADDRLLITRAQRGPDGLETASVWASSDGLDWSSLTEAPPTLIALPAVLVDGDTIVLTSTHYYGDEEESLWQAAISDDGGRTWDVSVGWPGMSSWCGLRSAMGTGAIVVIDGCPGARILWADR